MIETPPGSSRLAKTAEAPSKTAEDIMTTFTSPTKAAEPDNPYAFLHGFDTVFLIDDSESMAINKWREAAQALKTITPTCNPHDADGIDVFFLNYDSSSHPRSTSSANAVHKIFQPGVCSGTPTGQRLRQILKPYLRMHLADHGTSKPLNILAIADGLAVHGEDNTLLDLMSKLDKPSVLAQDVGAQHLRDSTHQTAPWEHNRKSAQHDPLWRQPPLSVWRNGTHWSKKAVQAQAPALVPECLPKSYKTIIGLTNAGWNSAYGVMNRMLQLSSTLAKHFMLLALPFRISGAAGAPISEGNAILTTGEASAFDLTRTLLPCMLIMAGGVHSLYSILNSEEVSQARHLTWAIMDPVLAFLWLVIQETAPQSKNLAAYLMSGWVMAHLNLIGCSAKSFRNPWPFALLSVLVGGGVLALLMALVEQHSVHLTSKDLQLYAPLGELIWVGLLFIIQSCIVYKLRKTNAASGDDTEMDSLASDSSASTEDSDDDSFAA